MTPLNAEEKIRHHNAIGQFILRVNNSVLHPKWADTLFIIQVAYGIKVEDAYLYFDYPYSKNVDVLNEALQKDKRIAGVDVLVHKKFFIAEEQGKQGYIHYKFTYQHAEETFYLHEANSNMDCTMDELRKYLPLVHASFTGSLSYPHKVVKQPAGEGYTEVIVLCSTPAKGSLTAHVNGAHRTEKNGNVMICTFHVTGKGIQVDQSLIDWLYQQAMYFMGSYFASPLAEKVLQERRRSETLAYHHSLNNLELDSCVETVEQIVTHPTDLNPLLLKKTLPKFRTMLLLQYSLFQAEYLRVGNYDLNVSTNLSLLNKSVTGILQGLVADYNTFPIENRLIIASSAAGVDFVPQKGDRDNLNPEFYDILLILYNLWQNANIVAYGKKADYITVRAEEKEGALLVSFTNRGKMFQEYIDFINGVEINYPLFNTNPNKLYRGLEIVRDKCQNHNRQWKLHASLTQEHDQVWHTTVSIHFINTAK